MGSNSSYNCTPFLHSLQTKGKCWGGEVEGAGGLESGLRVKGLGFTVGT